MARAHPRADGAPVETRNIPQTRELRDACQDVNNNQISAAATLNRADFHLLIRICPRENPLGLSRTELC